MNYIEHNEIKKKAIFGTIWNFMERFLAQGISFIVSLIVARILLPTDYSVISIVTIFFNFATVIISGGLNTALIQKKDADDLDYSSVLCINILLSIAVYIILYFLAPNIAKIYDNNLLVKIIRVMALILPINAIKSIWCAYISSKLQFKKFFFATLGGTVFSGIVGIILAIKGYGPWALVFQQMINAFVDTVILIATTKLKLARHPSFDRLKKLFKYGWKIFVSSLIGCIYSEFSPLVIGIKFSSSDLSYYSKGKEFPSLISTSTTQTLSSVLFPVLSKFQDDKNKLLDYTRKFIRVCSYIVFPAMLGFFAISENFVLVVLTEKWIDCVYYIRVFCICMMFDIVAIGNCETIKAFGRSDIYLIIEIIKKILYFISIIIFLAFSNNPKIFVLSSIVCTIIQVLSNSIPNIKLIGYKVKDQIIDLLTNLFISIVMMTVVFLIGLIPINKIILLILQIVVGITTYLLLSIITKNKALLYIKNLIFSLGEKNEK